MLKATDLLNVKIDEAKELYTFLNTGPLKPYLDHIRD